MSVFIYRYIILFPDVWFPKNEQHTSITTTTKSYNVQMQGKLTTAKGDIPFRDENTAFRNTAI